MGQRQFWTSLAFAVLAVAPSVCPAQDKTAEVQQAFREVETATNKHDVAAFERLLVNDFMFVTRTGDIFDRQEYLAREKRGAMLAGGKTEILKIRLYGDTALVTDRYTDTTSKGSLNIVATHVFVKEGGAWKWASFQGSRVPDAAPGR